MQPHRSGTFKLSADPLVVEKVRDIVGLYLDPPDLAVVLCVDEKSQIRALDHTQPMLSMRPGQVERRTHDYKLTEKQLRRGVHRSTEALETAIQTYIDAHNAEPRPFRWIKSADDILAAINRFCL